MASSYVGGSKRCYACKSETIGKNEQINLPMPSTDENAGADGYGGVESVGIEAGCIFGIS